jgi:hypothetical protein
MNVSKKVKNEIGQLKESFPVPRLASPPDYARMTAGLDTK